MSEDLPFVCEDCGGRFGFGEDGIAFLSFMRNVPFTNALKPCCGETITGTIIKEDDGSYTIELSP